MRNMAVSPGQKLGTGAVEGVMQPFLVEWLEQVIEGVCLKCAHCILVVSSRKNHDWHVLGIRLTQHLKAIHVGHLDVQEKQIGCTILKRLSRLNAVLAFGNDLHFRFLLQKQPQLFSSQVFIIRYDRSHLNLLGISLPSSNCLQRWHSDESERNSD